MNGEDRGTIQDWVNENYSHIPESIQRGRRKVYVHYKESSSGGFEEINPLDQKVIGYETGVSRHISQGRKSLKDVCQGVFP